MVCHLTPRDGDAKGSIHPHQQAVVVWHGVCGQGPGVVIAGGTTALASPVQIPPHDEYHKEDDENEEDCTEDSADDDRH